MYEIRPANTVTSAFRSLCCSLQIDLNREVLVFNIEVMRLTLIQRFFCIIMDMTGQGWSV